MSIDLEKACLLPNILDEFLDYYNMNQKKKVYLYGAGAGLIWNIRLLKKYNIPVDAIVDKQYSQVLEWVIEGTLYKKFPLRECKFNEETPIFVISAPAHEIEIKKFLAEEFPQSKAFCFDATLDVLQDRKGTEQYRTYVKNNTQELLRIHDCLADDDSKKVLWNILCGGLTYNLTYYRNVGTGNVYFPSVIREHVGQQEVLVDAGAFTGDTIEEFINTVGEENYKSIYAFEPDINNFKELERNTKNKSKIHIFNKGCYDRSDTLFFKADIEQTDAAAHVSEEKEATQKIDVVKLDDVIIEKVTFIKMDIEGSEMAALKGAEQLIKKWKPKLAISAYHKMQDIIEIVSYIQKLNPDYQLYLYHYWECAGSDTVIVAV